MTGSGVDPHPTGVAELRGGYWSGFFQVTWPFGLLRVRPDRLEVLVSGFSGHVVDRAEIGSVVIEGLTLPSLGVEYPDGSRPSWSFSPINMDATVAVLLDAGWPVQRREHAPVRVLVRRLVPFLACGCVAMVLLVLFFLAMIGVLR